MSIELHWGSGSTPAWRVMLALAFKGLPYTSKLLSFSARDTRSPAFLALNPRGKVPTLVHDGLVLNESLAILAYLDRAFPDRPIFGTTAAAGGRIWRHVMEYESHGNPTFSAVARPILFGRAVDEAEAVRAAVPALHAELDTLNTSVANGYFEGDTLSAADFVWYCGVAFLLRAATRPAAQGLDLGLLPFAARWPNVVRWAGNVEAIPGFDATIPPHWLEGDHPSPARVS